MLVCVRCLFIYIRDMKKYLITTLLVLSIVFAKAQTNTSNNLKAATADSIYDVVDQNASFPDGMDAMYKYIGKHIDFPESARINKISGKVFVRFIIEKDGSLSGFTILRSPSEDLGNAAVKVLKSMPRWVPAKVNNLPVRQVFAIPIVYNYGGETQTIERSTALSSIKSDTVIAKTQISAHFLGGGEAFSRFVEKKLKNPGVKGKVTLSFIVELDGTLSTFKIVNSLLPAADKEAIRVVKSSPRWMPSFVGILPVRQTITLDVLFD